MLGEVCSFDAEIEREGVADSRAARSGSHGLDVVRAVDRR